MFRKVRRILFNLTHPVKGEIWQLHHICDAEGDYAISPEKLESLILQYKAIGYRFVSLDEALSGAHKFVSITLDDGYEDNYLNALPLFIKHSCPFCIFVTTDYVFDDQIRKEHSGMTPKQFQTISQNALCTIGAHTKSHCHLSSLPIDKQWEEICVCKELLSEEVGRDINYFAYPYGDYNTDTISLVKKVGFKNAFAAWGGAVRDVNMSSFVIPRILI